MPRLSIHARCALMVLLPACTAVGLMPSVTGQLTVDTEFEGASARVLNIDPQRGQIDIMPGGDPEQGWPAWWCFRVTGLTAGQTLSIRLRGSSGVIPPGRPGAGKPLSPSWSMPTHASWSADGQQWQHTPAGKRDTGRITWQLKASDTALWIAWGPLATPSIASRWIDDVAEQSADAVPFELAVSRGDLTVRGVRITSPATADSRRPVIWFQARQHAWESGSSWVARGVMDWLTSDSPDADWLRRHAEIYVVPIMDVDRCVTGDGGKESVPHDHNRDWSADPWYPEVAAVQERVRDWISQRRLSVFIDLHNPGASDRQAFFFVAPNEVMSTEATLRRSAFLDTVSAGWNSPVPLDRKTRSTGPGYHPLWSRISTTWVARHAPASTVSVCLETAWNTPHSTTTGYRRTGAALATGVSRFLQQNPATIDSTPPEESR